MSISAAIFPGAAIPEPPSPPCALYEIACLPLLGHLQAVLDAIDVEERVFLSPDAHSADCVRRAFPRMHALHGTDMLQKWRQHLHAGKRRHVLLLSGNMPFLRPASLAALFAEREGEGKKQGGLTLLGLPSATDTASDHHVLRLNDGSEFFTAAVLAEITLLARLLAQAASSAELPVSVAGFASLALRQGVEIQLRQCDAEEVFAVHDRRQQAQGEAIMQAHLRQRALQNGVCLQEPASVHFSFDTQLQADVIIEPHVVFAPGVEVGRGARIRAFSHLEGCVVAPFACVGPYARLRPQTRIGEGARIGNFVEIKHSNIGADARINHLAYVGDAEVGARVNIGAGAITCNYDGSAKHQTRIEADAFIGSNSALVAPLRIGRGAYVGSGSTITEDVEEEALALARARQSAHPGGARRLRARQKAAKSGQDAKG